MRMALGQAGSGDPDELALRSQLINGLRAAVAHAGPQAADHLEDRVRQRSLVGHASFDAFGHQLLLAFLEIAVLGADRHCRYTLKERPW